MKRNGEKKEIRSSLSPDNLAIKWVKENILKIFNNQKLFETQNKAITNVVGKAGSATVCVLPTGSGKTRIAQAAVISQKNKTKKINETGPTIIISPTISLIDDQEKEWVKFNKMIKNNVGEDVALNLRFLTHAKLKNEEISIFTIINELIEGKIDVLCCSPESLLKVQKGVSLVDYIPQLSVDDGCQFSNFIVDEAHIMFDWKDFRPTYSLLPQLESMIRTLNPNLRTLLMTATLNPDEIEKILNKFGRNYSESNVEVIRKSEIRQDLAFTIIKDKNLNYGDFENSTRLMQQEDSIQSHKWRLSKFQYEIDNYSPPLLIYTHEKKHCRQISKKLNYQPKFKNIYHGDTSSDKRRKILLAFMNDEIKSLVATSAFGMGVNKGNIWLTGYIGSPPNLKELYQMFGRTARDSRWNESESKKRNGNCIAIVPTKEKQLSFNPPMKTNASMIRIAEMFSQECKITHNGYVIIPIMMSEISNYLYPQKKEDKIVKWRKKSISDRVVLEKKWKEHEDNFVNGESDKRIKSLLLMQESGAIEIKGLHYENPIIRDGLVGKSLTELLEQGGYNGVVSEISKVGKNNTGFNRIGNKFVIIKITKNIDGEKDFIKFINEGLDKEKTSYEHGVNQLKKLIKSNECIRKGFAPLIGAQNLRTCLDEYINNQSNPLPLGEFAPAPCSVCRCNAGKDKTILKEIRDILFYNEKKPSIWLEEDQIELLSGRKKITDAKEESVFIDIKNCKLNEITMLDLSLIHI